MSACLRRLQTIDCLPTFCLTNTGSFFERNLLSPHHQFNRTSVFHYSMETKVHCCCSQCFPSKLRILRTAKAHLKKDQTLLLIEGQSIGMIEHIERCIQRLGKIILENELRGMLFYHHIYG